MNATLKKFAEILCGTLDNQKQIDAEIAAGKQIHPYAKHVTDVCDHRIINRPEGHPGIYILEESYYVKPGQSETEIKPLFFYITVKGDNSVLLHSIQVPLHMKPEEVINANDDLVFDFNELEMRPWGPAEYTWHEDKHCFTVDHEDPINGIVFRLTETLKEGELFVMELVHKDGVKITPYDTPIHYIKQ